MKNSKSAKILSTVLALALILCSLPFALGITASAESTVLNYSDFQADGALHFSDYTKLGMHDANGLEILNGGILVTDLDWAYQINSVDKYVELGSAYAVYDVTGNTDFTATFSDTTNMNAMKFYISENMLDWFVAEPTIDGKTAVAALPYYARYFKIVWPVQSPNSNGLVSVNFSKPEATDNFVSLDYEEASNNGAYQSNGSMNLLNNGVIEPDWGAIYNKTSANSYNGYLTYLVKSNTYFSFSVTTQKSNNNWTASIPLDDIAKKMGYENPLDFNYKIYLSKDNVNFVAIEDVIKDFKPVYSARYANFEGKRADEQGDYNAPRSTDYNFIVPDGYSYVKCCYPLTQAASSIIGTDGNAVSGDAGNDWFSVNKVEYTGVSYNYDNSGNIDYVKSEISADTASDFGMSAYTNELERKANGIIDTTWDNQYNSRIPTIQYAVKPGTPFYAGFKFIWSNLGNYAAKKDFVMYLQGYNGADWVDVSQLVITKENCTQASYLLTASAEKMLYSRIRIKWPSRVDGLDVGDDCIGLAWVDFTEKASGYYDYTECLLTDNMVNYGIVSASTSNKVVADKDGKGLVLDYNGLSNYSTAGGAGEAYITYKVAAGKVFKLSFTRNSYYNNSKVEDLYKRWCDPSYLIKAYTSATDSFEAKTEHPITYTSDDGLSFSIEFTVPYGEENIKVTFPQNGRMSEDYNPEGWYNYTGNDYLYIKSVLITEADLTVDKLEADTTGVKTEYYKKDALNLAGLKAELTYNNGEVRTVDYGYTVSGYDSDKLGDQTVTVSYGSASDTVGVKVYVYDGDLNCDKKVDILDFVRIKKIAAGFSESDGASADLDGSGEVEAADVALMRLYLLGTITEF